MEYPGAKLPVLDLLFKESEAYSGLANIESYLQEGADLQSVPVQPLYVAMKSLDRHEVAAYLPKLSPLQRQAFLDLDLWAKDDLDIEEFNFWPKAYASCEDDDIRFEFASGNAFALYLKGAVNIWTFDAEEPEYPDHDNYFLTEDNMLLVEFHPDFDNADEVKALVRDLYSRWGVEQAYTYLFKIVSDAFSQAQEEEYTFKKGRQEDLGFVDYYDALEMENCFPKVEVMRAHLLKKKKFDMTPSIDEVSKGQGLHQSSVAPYRNRLNPLLEELALVSDTARRDFLQFNFIRLSNGRLAFDEAVKSGQVAINQSGKLTAQLLMLGYDALKNDAFDLGELGPEGLFKTLDFVDLYRVGKTLLELQRRKVKKLMAEFLPTGPEGELKAEAFVGPHWSLVLEALFEHPAKEIQRQQGERAQELTTYAQFQVLEREVSRFGQMLPFISKLHQLFEGLVKEGRVQDSYYLNYTLDDIDFESLLISAYILHASNLMQEKRGSKLGLTVEEFKAFIKKHGLGNEDNSVAEFCESFGLAKVEGAADYLKAILDFHLSGMDILEMPQEDFKHLGGPILLS